MLQNLVPDTPYNITVEAVYPEGPGGSLTGAGRTGKIPDIPEVTKDPKNNQRSHKIPETWTSDLCSLSHSGSVESQEPPRVRRVVHPVQAVLGPSFCSSAGIQGHLLSCR